MLAPVCGTQHSQIMTDFPARHTEHSEYQQPGWLKSFLLSALAGWATAIFLVPLTGINGSGRYLLPLEGRLSTDAIVAGTTLLTYLICVAILLIVVVTSLRLLKMNRPWAYLLVAILIPICLLLAFPPDIDDITFISSPSFIVTLGIWVMLRGKNLPPMRARLATIAQALTAIGIVACIGFLISSHVILARENETGGSLDDATGGRHVLGGAATNHELLAYDWAGALVSYRLPDWRSKTVAQSGVVSVVHDQSGIWTMSLPPLPRSQQYDDPLQPGQFTVSRYDADRLTPLASGKFEADDRPVAFLMRDGAPVVVGRRSIYQFDANRNGWNSTTLRPAMERAPGDIIAATAFPNGNTRFAYLAFNIGEFGGGILKIDLQTGVLQKVERRDSDELCAGPLNADCDPVTGIVPDPTQQGCILASIGLRHMLEHGRIIRVCDGRVTVVTEMTSSGASIGRKIRQSFGQKPKAPLPFSEAFFGLVADKLGRVWATSTRAVYRYDGKQFQMQKLPELERYGDILATTKVPGVVMLSTDMNARNSLSGSTPLIVPIN